MPSTFEALEELAVKAGKSYFFAGNENLDDEGSISIIIKSVNDLEMYLRSIVIDSDASMAEWELFLNPVFSGGTALNLNSRNTAAATPKRTGQ
jgi:hypothetical protein